MLETSNPPLSVADIVWYNLVEMLTLHMKARARTDGTLELHAPTPLPEGEVEVTLLIHTAHPPALEWAEGYFERTFGRWEGELARPEQGTFETREALDEVSA